MLTAIAVVLLALLIRSCIILKRDDNWEEDICFIIIYSFLLFLVSIGLINSTNNVVSGRTIDDKIAMYQEENAVIEEQIDALVTQYMEYEQDTYGSLKGESSITLVSLYPELKADALVNKQCEMYMNNNEKIKELKEDKINLKAEKWWLYFGK